MKALTSDQDKTRMDVLFSGLGIMGAILSASCCVLPLLFFVLGISGAWISNFTILAPYQPIFIVLALFFTGLGLWHYRKMKQDQCGDDQYCGTLRAKKNIMLMAAFSMILVSIAVLFPVIAPFILS
ncbi:MAG: mercuric transporter MerT family protein [Alphaproteobacteria bacterium]|nr:mercuric transporter MerT family protein [Alphaproteobacteria bacterium]